MIGIQLCNRLYAKLFYCYIAILLEQLDSIILLLRYFATSLLRYFVTPLYFTVLQASRTFSPGDNRRAFSVSGGTVPGKRPWLRCL